MLASVQRLKEMLLAKRHSPRYLARGSGIGVFVSLAPTIGVQIPLLIALRWLLRRWWPFHLPLAIAWTLPTNVLTLPIFYYVYVVTGRIMLGQFDRLRGFEVFSERLANAFASATTWYESVWIAAVDLSSEFGLPLLIGWVPWALTLAVAGYWMTLRWRTRKKLQASAGS